MDINLLRSLVTLFAFITFLAIIVWAWSGRRKADFEQAARIPLDDDQAEDRALRGPHKGVSV